jgi:hypothetical protein
MAIFFTVKLVTGVCEEHLFSVILYPVVLV